MELGDRGPRKKFLLGKKTCFTLERRTCAPLISELVRFIPRPSSYLSVLSRPDLRSYYFLAVYSGGHEWEDFERAICVEE